MNAFKYVMALMVVLVAQAGHASGFEFCDIEGSVEKIEMPSKGKYELTVVVAKSTRAKELGDISYTDCYEHVGEHLDAGFAEMELPRVPVVGDRISFSRSVVDGFNASGAYVGTSINTELHSLRKRSAMGGR
jgi:hypothetical protein